GPAWAARSRRSAWRPTSMAGWRPSPSAPMARPTTTGRSRPMATGVAGPAWAARARRSAWRGQQRGGRNRFHSKVPDRWYGAMSTMGVIGLPGGGSAHHAAFAPRRNAGAPVTLNSSAAVHHVRPAAQVSVSANTDFLRDRATGFYLDSNADQQA